MQPISAPIPVPGTQQAPTTPSNGTGSGCSSDIQESVIASGIITSSSASTNNNNNYNGGGGHGRSSSSSARVATHQHHHHHSNATGGGGGGSINNNNNTSLSRFPSIGNTKKLSLENQTLRAKIAELERYLTGLKEELILANRQIHARNLENKLLQERKDEEIHDLTQQLQRAEFELAARTAEMDTLQNQLQHQAKEQMSKIRHIDMLETQIQDYKRISVNSGTGSSSSVIPPVTSVVSPPTTTATTVVAATTTATAATAAAAAGSESVESIIRAALGSSADADADKTSVDDGGGSEQRPSASSHEENQKEDADIINAELESLKDESARKDEQIEQLKIKLEQLIVNHSNLEQENKRLAVGDSSKNNNNNTTEAVEASSFSVSGSESNQSFFSSGVATSSVQTSFTSLNHGQLHHHLPVTTGTSTNNSGVAMVKAVNSVGYDISVEHPKLLVRYQALRLQHAQASEYVDSLESENRDLKIQLLDVSSMDLMTATAAEPVLATSSLRMDGQQHIEAH
ncbi:hypothetical protein BG004_001216 [Podila humilis]|nr:hypothetical protein BG004_001216 [Podila humilis]